MRRIAGNIILPENTPSITPVKILIEARDISVADAPSVLLAEKIIRGIALHPGNKIKFEINVPEAAAGRMLSMRVHIDINGNGKVDAGDLLTTANYPITAKGNQENMNVPVMLV